MFQDPIKIYAFNHNDNLSVWIASEEIKEEMIENIEKHFQNLSEQSKEDTQTVLEDLFGISGSKEKTAKNIIDVTKDIIKSYDFKDIYIMGSYPRNMLLKTPSYLIENIDFTGNNTDQIIKLGGLVADRLGICDVNIKTNNLSFVYGDIIVSFNGQFVPEEIKGGMKDLGIEPNPININAYNKDFTINMMLYNVINDKIIDVSGKAQESIDKKEIRTFFDPQYICQQNPMIILRALKLKIRHNMQIDSVLEDVMKKNAGLLFDGRYSDIELIIARENVKKEGIKEAEKLFKEFGLDRIEKVR